MSEPTQSAVTNPLAKAATALGGAGLGFAGMSINEWASLIASVLAGVYSLILISEWAWKRFIQGRLIDAGWIKPRARRRREDGKPLPDAAE